MPGSRALLVARTPGNARIAFHLYAPPPRSHHTPRCGASLTRLTSRTTPAPARTGLLRYAAHSYLGCARALSVGARSERARMRASTISLAHRVCPIAFAPRVASTRSATPATSATWFARGRRHARRRRSSGGVSPLAILSRMWACYERHAVSGDPAAGGRRLRATSTRGRYA